MHALFLQAIFIFVRESVAWQHFGRKLQPWDRIVVAPDGTRLQLDSVSLKTFHDQERFEASMAPAVFGEDLAVLSDRDEKAWALAPDNVREALGQLGDEDILVRKRAVDLLKTRVYLVQPCLIRRSLETTKSECREAAHELIKAHYRYLLNFDLDPWKRGSGDELRKITGESPFRQLPYGVALPKRIEGGCGISVEEPPEGEAMPKADQDRVARTTVMLCGMASMKTPSYSFVTFLTK